ncbi:MAG: hypothetical protein JNM18_14275, partial [Planctomycetaceae bacterium]|nr:hypothetical protein [Planctomycetaceae bacterium]
NTRPTSVTVNEDFTVAITGLSITDVDAGTQAVQVLLAAGAGTLSLLPSVGGGVTLDDISGNGTGTITITAPLASINATLANASGLRFTPAPNATAATTITISTDDLGKSGNGGPLTDTDTITVNVLAMNDVPVNTVPSSITVLEDVPTAITGISVSDIDAPAVEVVLSVGSGVLNVRTDVAGGVFPANIHNNGTGSVTIIGSLSEVNATLGDISGLIYTPVLNATTGTTLTVATNDGGFTGLGGWLFDTDTIAINLTPLNDAPVNSHPTTATVLEDIGTRISGLSISDVDAGSSNISVTFTAASGTLNLAGTVAGGVTSGQVTGNGTGTITVIAPLANINATLLSGTAGLRLTTVPNSTAATTITMVTNDLGNSGSGGPLTDTDTITINVSAFNDAPVNTVPLSVAVFEDVPTAISGISISDTDASSQVVQVTLSVGSGSLSLATNVASGLTQGNLTGNGTGTVSIIAPLSQINTTLADASGLFFTTSLNATAGTTLTILSNDLGASGAGGAKIDTDTVALSLVPTDDAPVNSVPGLQIVDEDQALTVSGISIVDIDAASAVVSVTLSVGSGTITINSSAVNGVTDGQISGNGSAVVTLTGSQTAINNTLSSAAAVVYRGTLNFSGSDFLTVLTNDLGNSGTGGPLTDVDTIAIAVTPVNDGPIVSVPTAHSVDEDTNLTVTGISISDVDAGTNAVLVTLTVASGSLTISASAVGGVTAGQITGNGSSTVTLNAPLAKINATMSAAAGLVYRGQPNFNGGEVLTITANDLGYTGTGALTDVDCVAITVHEINDAPVNHVTSPQVIVEAVPSAVTGLSITDIDADSANVSVTLSVGFGTLVANSSVGGGVTSGEITGSGSATVTITAPLARINATLANASGLRYLSGGTFAGTDLITIVTNDLGNTGSPGALIDIDTVVLNGSGTVPNTAPVNLVPAGIQYADEDTPLAIMGVSIVDADAGFNAIRVTLNAAHGTIHVATNVAGGVTLGEISANGSGAVTINASLGAINATFADVSGLVYQGSLDFWGCDALSMVTNDLGNTGTPGPLTDSATIQIAVSAVDDAPTGSTSPGATSYTENQSPVFIDPAVTVSDDTVQWNAGTMSYVAQLTGATVQFTGNYAAGEDILDYNGAFGISVAFNSVTGTLNLSGVTTLANYQQALRWVTYHNLSDNPSQLDRTVTFSLFDNTTTASIGTKVISVAATNDGPVLNLPGTRTLSEDSSLAVTGISLSDLDLLGNPANASNNVTVTFSVQHGVLLLNTSVINGINVGQLSGNGSTSLTITAPLAAINATLADATGLLYSTDANYFGSDAVTISVNDLGNTGSGGALIDTDTLAITVNGINDAPIITASASVLNYVEDSPATAVDSGLALFDVEANVFPGNGTFTGATISITTGYVAGQDFLGFTPQAGISGVFNPATGVLTLTGSATAADYLTTLQSVTYFNSSNTPAIGSRVVSFQIDDHGLASNVTSRTLNVSAANDAPGITTTA